MAQRFQTSQDLERARGLAGAQAALRRGDLVVVPFEGGYVLAADAFGARGITALRDVRVRPELVPQLAVGRIRAVAGIAAVGPAARDLMVGFWPGPLTLLLVSHPSLSWSVCKPGGQIAVRLPLQPVAIELAVAFGPLAIVPAAPAGLPAPKDPQEVLRRLGGHCAVLLDAGTLPEAPSSTVVDASREPPRLIRHGGFAEGELRAVVPNLEVGEP